MHFYKHTNNAHYLTHTHISEYIIIARYNPPTQTHPPTKRSVVLHVYLSVVLHVYLSVVLHVYLSVVLHVYLSVVLHVYLSMCVVVNHYELCVLQTANIKL